MSLGLLRRSGRRKRPRSLGRLAALGILAAVAAQGILVDCTRELDPARGEAGLDLRWTWPSPAPAISLVDSARLWVLDSGGKILVGPATAPVDSGGEVDFTVRVPAGEDREVRLQFEGRGDRGRGVIASGRATGIGIPRGGAVSTEVRLESAVPRMQPIEAVPGADRFFVRWSRVSAAASYELLARSGGAETRRAVPDTFVSFPLFGPAGFAELPAPEGAARGGAADRPAKARPVAALDSTFYRARAILPWGARSIVSDSTGISIPALNDLPRITAVDPPPETTGVPDSSWLALRFSRPIDPGTLGDITVPSEGNSVTLRREPNGAVVSLLYEWAEGGALLRLHPAAPLRRDARYRLAALPLLRDLEGRPLDQAPSEVGLQGFESFFSTEPYDPLRVIGVAPADGANDVPLRTAIETRLNREARAASVHAATVVLADSAGSAVAAGVALAADSIIRLVPNEALRFATRYRLTVTSGVRDRRGREGEPLDQDPLVEGLQPFTSTFRTLPQPPGPRVLAVAPSDGAPAVPVGETVRVRFSRPVQAATVPGNVSVRRLPVGAAISGSFSGSTDRREFAFTPTLLERGERYRVVVAAGGYDGQGRPFGVLDDEGIPFDQDSTLAGYQEFSSLFRVEDNPRVTAVAPADGRTGVPVDTVVSVRFSLPVARPTVAAGGLALRGDGSPVPIAAYEWSADSLEVRLRPEAELAFFRSYTVAADTSIRSTRGSRFDQRLDLPGYQSFTSAFRTATDGIAPRVVEWTPGDTAQNAPVTGPVRVRFNRAIVPGTVADESNFHLRRLPSGTLVPATRTIDPDSASATLYPMVPLDYLTQYQVTVTKFVEDPFGQQLDQDPDAPFNQDFTGTFRTAQERIPPAVAEIDPSPGATDVPIGATVTVTFTEPMGYAGTLEGAFALAGPDGPVAGGAVLTPDARQLLFSPAAPLRHDVRFDVRVDTTATDQAGNRLDQFPATGVLDPFASFFFTEADAQPPRVLASQPADGDSAVEVTVRPVLELDEPCAPASLLAGVRLVDSLLAAVVPAAVVPSFDGRSAEVVPEDSLRFDSFYILEATSAVLDTSGNALDQDAALPGDQPFRARFRTRRENIPPRVREVLFSGGPPLPAGGFLRVVFSEACDPAGVTGGGVRLERQGLEVPASVTAPAPDTALVVPADTLLHDTEYRLTVAGVRDLIGNELDQDPDTPGAQAYVLDFVTEPDLVPPHVSWVFPGADSQGVSPDVVCEVRFSEPVDPSSVVSPAFALYHADVGAQLVPGVITAEGDSVHFSYRPSAALLDSARYLLRVDAGVLDLAGNPLDQDTTTMGSDPFESEFRTGVRPIAVAGPAVCDPDDSTRVSVDGSGSEDPDGGLARVVWDWGDGARDTLLLPDPRWPATVHDYACLDARGCDGLDNDGDGDADETGTEGCDESFRVILSVEDSTGIWAADTTGVAFCAFLVLDSDPPDGAGEVDSALAAVRLRVSRELTPALLDPDRFLLAEDGGDSLEVSLSWNADSSLVVLAPGAPLRSGRVYRVLVVAPLSSADGRPFDQDPCLAGRQGYEGTFTTAPRVPLPRQSSRATSPGNGTSPASARSAGGS